MSSGASQKRVWPVLVADLADEAARDFLLGIALAGGRAFLPLIAAPADASTHIVEIYTPAVKEPLLLFAKPLGAPSAVGFPLRLRPFDPATPPWPDVASKSDAPPPSGKPSEPPLTSSDAAAVLRPKAPTNHSLTARHTQDLIGKPQASFAPEQLLGRSLANGKLVIESLLGSGGIGAVFRAQHRDLRIPVAVKILHESFQKDIEFCRRFHAEALAASRLDHANLMRVLDFGQEPDGLLYLAMEYLHGISLGDVIEDRRVLPLERIVRIMQQVCAGLAHAHTRGVIHRDIKPDNVMLIANHDDDERPDELVKVCDFGIAVTDRDPQSTAIIGTPEYMSPEQCRAEPLDGRSDVYSCGVMLYELATAEMPFTGDTSRMIVDAQIHRTPRPPSLANPDVNAALEAIILRALSKRPDERQQSMRQLRSELKALVEPQSSSPKPPSVGTRPPSSGPPTSSGPLSSSGPPTSSGPPPSSRRSPSSGSSGARADWLETHSSGYHGALYAPESTLSGAVRLESGRILAAELRTKPAQWLGAFAAAPNEEAFRVLARQLEEALPELLGERNVKALFAIHSTLDVLADERQQPAWRTAVARRVQRAYLDGSFLGFLAELALGENEMPREAARLFVGAGGPATYALYSTRLRLSVNAGVRTRFVARVSDFGVVALPMIRAGLAKLEPKRDLVVASDLAQDLFEAAPRVRDEEAGTITAAYLRDAPPPLMAAAARAIAAFWGPRAMPLLVGLLDTGEPAVVIAALESLRETGAVDVHVERRIAAVASSTTDAGVRAAARAALGPRSR